MMDTTILTLLNLYLFPRHGVTEQIIDMILRYVPGGRNVRQISLMGSLNGAMQRSIQLFLISRVGGDLAGIIWGYVLSSISFVRLPRIKMTHVYETGDILWNGTVYTQAEFNEYNDNDGYGCDVPCCHCRTSFETKRIERFLQDPNITFWWDKLAIPENFKCRTLKHFLKFLYTKMVCDKHDSLVENSPFAGNGLYAFEVKIVTADTRVYTYLSHAATVSKKTIVSFVIVLHNSPHDQLVQFCNHWQ